jgi:hypothetical protein
MDELNITPISGKTMQDFNGDGKLSGVEILLSILLTIIGFVSAIAIA